MQLIMKAIILKKTPFSETNEVVTMYTRELGKVRAVARAVKSPKSRLAYALHSLFYTEVELLPSKKMQSVIGVKPVKAFSGIYADDNKAVLALYATEVLLKATADEQPNPRLFDAMLEFLEHLDVSARNSPGHLCADAFILRILGLCGYGLTAENIRNFRGVPENLPAFISKSENASLEALDSENVPARAAGELHKFVETFAQNVLERNLNAAGLLGTL